MSTVPRTGVLLVFAMVGIAVGLVETATRGDWDLSVVLLAVLGLVGAALAGQRSTRRAVPVRPDLAEWLRAQAAATGEPAGRVADRALAAYRAELFPEPGEPR